MGLSACIADDVGGTADVAPDEDSATGVRYLSLRVGTADSDSLKAAVRDSGTDFEVGSEFENGTDFEHTVDFSGKSENVLIFITGDWKYSGYSVLEFDRYSAQGEGYDKNKAEASYIGFLHPQDIFEINNMPEYGMVVVNAHNITEALNELQPEVSTIEDVLALVDCAEDSHVPGRSGNYFTMTSAAYLDQKTDVWQHSVVFKIDKTKIFDNRQQAVIQPAATAVVERMSAKFNLSLPGAINRQGVNFLPDGGRAQVIVCNYIDGQPSYNNRTWTCSVSAWGINKYEPESYYFRNITGGFRDETAIYSGTYPYNYGETISNVFFKDWNKPSEYRTLWAIDPHYSTGTYPTQYRQAVDNQSVEYYGKEDRQPSLAYVSYNELSSDLSGFDVENGCATLYSPENTFPDNRVSGHWQHDLAGCEVVIGAQIHVNGVDDKRADYDLFRNRIGVFYPSKRDFANYFISTINTQLASQSTMTYRYYNWNEPESNSGTSLKTFKVDNTGYKLYYRGVPLTAEVMASLEKMTIPATIENGDGKVIPWVDGMSIGRRKVNPDTYEEEGEVNYHYISVDDFKSLIYDWIGAFDHFNRGRMVYSVPVRYRATKEQVSASKYTPKVGDYGVVRNAWYRIAVDEINSLGTPVDDPDQPIIPYEANLENSIMMEINVLDWHKFETDVNLPDKLK